MGNSAIYDLQKDDRTNPARLATANLTGGAVHVAVVPCLLGAGTVGHTLNLCKLPVGAIPLPGLSFVICEDAGGTLTMNVGTAEDEDMLAAGIDLAAAAGRVQFTNSATFPALLAPARLASADVIAKVVTSGTPLTTAQLVFHIAYKLPA